ncbi:MAG: hypothetical protein Q8941_16125 [Bacteroidota bacterium]|nr:hypothetical protein [Bacteroidota bacterium]
MIILVIIVVLLGIAVWLLISPFIVEIDTRIPQAGVRWVSIGSARVWYEDEWWFSIRIFFFRKTMRFSEIKAKPKKIKDRVKKKARKKMKISRVWVKMVRVIKTFRVKEWQLAFDTGDHTRNAQLYPLNYLPYTFKHLYINFGDENYLVLKTRNRPWKVLYAFLR